MKLFLDANVIIYWVESTEPFYTRFISIMQSLYIKYPHASFAISRLSFLECRVKPLKKIIAIRYCYLIIFLMLTIY